MVLFSLSSWQILLFMEMICRDHRQIYGAADNLHHFWVYSISISMLHVHKNNFYSHMARALKLLLPTRLQHLNKVQ